VNSVGVMTGTTSRRTSKCDSPDTGTSAAAARARSNRHSATTWLMSGGRKADVCIVASAVWSVDLTMALVVVGAHATREDINFNRQYRD
jgi:hypothetical protein